MGRHWRNLFLFIVADVLFLFQRFFHPPHLAVKVASIKIVCIRRVKKPHLHQHPKKDRIDSMNVQAIIGVLFLCGCASLILFYRIRKFGMSGFTFFCRSNALLLTVAFWCVVVMPVAAELAYFFSNLAFLPPPPQGGGSIPNFLTRPALVGACVVLAFEAGLTAMVAYLNVRLVGPWDPRYQTEGLKNHRLVTLAVQGIWAIAFFVGWFARAELATLLATYGTSPYFMTSDRVPEVYVAVSVGLLELVFVTGWCCWHTYCNGPKYEEYLCPACHGGARGGGCEVCRPQYAGKLYMRV